MIFTRKRLAFIVVVAVGIVVFLFVLVSGSQIDSLVQDDQHEVSTSSATTAGADTPPSFSATQVIGRSVEGRPIKAYTYGSGPAHILFVGGIHGGYEWNSVLLSYRFIDYLAAHPEAIPDDLTVSVIPVANPDGLYSVIGQTGRFTKADVQSGAGSAGAGRFNAHGVDLNRNFACNWQPTSTWRGQPVSAGTGAFSEPEARAIRDFVKAHDPSAVIFWHSQANAVYASECNNGPLPETLEIMNLYAQAAGYRAVPSFTAYPITGDAEGWLAKIGVPAITVELSTHETVEWQRNLAGIKALFSYYSRP